MHIIVNGYGVPKNIRTDKSYHSYLGQTLNYLWDRYRNDTLTIILAGGPTDMYRPYRRTEAGEMLRWFRPRLRSLHLEKQWKVRTLTSGLSALDNLLAAKKSIKSGSVLYVCERTRESKSRVLVRKIFGANAKVMSIDFDTSRPRYDHETRVAMERDDMRYSLRALKDPVWHRKLRAANRLKIKVLRDTPEKLRAREIDRIVYRLRREYLKK
jgi:hypothetical protein